MIEKEFIMYISILMFTFFLSLLVCVTSSSSSSPSTSSSSSSSLSAAYNHDISSHQQQHSADIHAKQFCKYLQTNPEEAEVLIYNRVPKCGSQTFTNLLKRIQEADPQLATLSTMYEFWWPNDFDANVTLVHQLSSRVKQLLSKRGVKKVRANGHWYMHSFHPQQDFGVKQVEYFNILRNCFSRIKSHFFYDLLDSNKAMQARKDGTLQSYQHDILKASLSIEECVHSQECLKNAILSRLEDKNSLNGFMANYLCGTRCIQDHRDDLLAGALSQLNVHQHGGSVRGGGSSGYLVIGFVEHIEETLELLECAFPTYFKNAFSLYRKTRLHLHRSSVSNQTDLINHPNFDFLKPICQKIDDKLVKIAEDQFWAKLKIIRSNPSCCRKAS